MPQNIPLSFTIVVHAPRRRVWQALIGPDTYREWTAAFSEGSHFVGAWDEGAAIHFVAPGGDGMVAVIAEHRPAEWIAIRHLGEIRQGVEDTSSEAVRAWAPAHETYAFADHPEGCQLTATIEAAPAWEDYMRETFPKALARLKALCERG